MEMMKDKVTRVSCEDTVRGRWNAPMSEMGIVWCDANNIVTGVILEIGFGTVEDSAWLKAKKEYNQNCTY